MVIHPSNLYAGRRTVEMIRDKSYGTINANLILKTFAGVHLYIYFLERKREKLFNIIDIIYLDNPSDPILSILKKDFFADINHIILRKLTLF